MASFLHAHLRTTSYLHPEFALDRVRVRVIAVRDSKQALISQSSRSKAMPKFETLPVERSATIISSIMNLVCPQCGGSMMEFQCNGRCARNGSGGRLGGAGSRR